MEKMNYSNFISHALYNMSLRRIQMTDVFNTKCYLYSEYSSLYASSLSHMYFLLHTVSLDHELHFYMHLDMLTYLPFEKLGFEYLSKKLEKDGVSVNEFKYNKILQLLTNAKIIPNEDVKRDIKYFLDNYYNDVIEVNIIGLAIMSIRLFHRYVTIMSFEGGYPSMKVHKTISKTLDKIVADVNEKGLKEININDYLPEFDYNNQLSDEMIEHIELCLTKES